MHAVSPTREVLPNLFVIGAAKSGTTSVVAKLSGHPDVFVPHIKEPLYFSFVGQKPKWTGPDDPNYWPIYKEAEYLSLYKAGRAKAVRIDGSTTYLYDPNAPSRVAEAVPDAKIIVILRHPVDRAYSAFLHVRGRTLAEFSDFSAALAKEEERIRKGYEHLWHYRAMSRYSEQLERWYSHFPPTSIKVCLYDDLVNQPAKLFDEICVFLGLDPKLLVGGQAKENVSSVPRSSLLKRILLSENPLKNAISSHLPSLLRQSVWKLNSHKPSCPNDLREELIREFAEEVLKVQKLIKRDLSHWLPPNQK